ncbi:MAG: hypothetical protein KH354_03965 [Clostridiales bacterium]|nr:hypothetical protein [Clostridiales bacterium]
MSKTIKIQLNVRSIDRAIKELKEYQEWVLKKTDELMERLAEIGAAEASIRFARAYYDGYHDAEVSAEPIENGWVIKAQGQAVCFIEFGAGVYFNGSEPYSGERPSEISKIGEYGKGYGKRNAWAYYDKAGNTVLTHGTPAAMPMYHAGRVIQQEMNRIAKEVFSGD